MPFLLLYAFFQELTSSPIPKHEVAPEWSCQNVDVIMSFCSEPFVTTPPSPSSRGSSQPRDLTQIFRIAGGFLTSWATRKAQECWSGYPISSPADLPNPEIEPMSPALQVDSLPAKLLGKPPVTTPLSLEGNVHRACFGSALFTHLMAHCSSHLQPRLNPWAFAHPSLLSHSSFLP